MSGGKLDLKLGGDEAKAWANPPSTDRAPLKGPLGGGGLKSLSALGSLRTLTTSIPPPVLPPVAAEVDATSAAVRGALQSVDPAHQAVAQALDGLDIDELDKIFAHLSVFASPDPTGTDLAVPFNEEQNNDAAFFADFEKAFADATNPMLRDPWDEGVVATEEMQEPVPSLEVRAARISELRLSAAENTARAKAARDAVRAAAESGKLPPLPGRKAQ